MRRKVGRNENGREEGMRTIDERMLEDREKGTK
jgi:hypothetical protein